MSRCQMAVQLLVLAVSMLLIEETQAAITSAPCPRGASYGCKSPCYTSCDTINITSCHEKCSPGCVCGEGFVFQSSDSDVCVPTDSCAVMCWKNARFMPRYQEPLITCATLGIHYQLSEKFFPRCVCNEGYVLANEPNPRCIKEKECKV